MAASLPALLRARGWLLADGATATGLFEMGLDPGTAPELWNDAAPDRVRALHDAAIAAGSDLILTNTFGANACRLALSGAGDRVQALNRRGARIARAAADAAGRPVLVAGSMGPTGEGRARPEVFEAQARGLLDGGADLIWVETMSSPDEFAAAATAIARLGAPWCGTMSFHAPEFAPADMGRLVAGLDWPPLAYGANCGAGPADVLGAIRALAAAGPTLPLIAKANAGLPRVVAGRLHYDVTPADMADHARAARAAGAAIIGGCCGTTAAHLRAMRDALIRG